MINHAKHSLIAALIGVLICQFFTSYPNTLALFSGMIWGIANFVSIAFVMRTILIVKNYILLFPILLIKFPLLYWLGYWLLTVEIWNPWFVAIGFFVMLVVLAGSSLAHIRKHSIILADQQSRTGP